MLGRVVQGVLALAGLATFVILVREVDPARILAGESLGLLVGALLLLTLINYGVDTLSWWLVCDRNHRPSLLTLASIRARCEALTNTLPGGAVIGEPMKVMLLLRTGTMTTAEATTAFLLGKFSVIVGQVVYVVTGVALSYSAMNGGSERVFGTEHFATFVLGAALLVLLLMVSLLGAMIWFQPMLRWLVPTGGEGRWSRRWNRIVAEAHSIESMVAHAARTRGPALLLSILCGVTAWALNGVEAFLILRWLEVDITFAQAFAIDAVSCIVRMVVFVLPIGIGGQDWTITGLMSIHGVADPVGTSAGLVVLKRAREFVVIGIGLLLLLLAPGRAPVEATAVEPAEEERIPELQEAS